MKEIPLVNSYLTIEVDDDDYPWLMKYEWFIGDDPLIKVDSGDFSTIIDGEIRSIVQVYLADPRGDGKNIDIGRYDSEEEAARAYNRGALEVYGEFAVLNDIPNE